MLDTISLYKQDNCFDIDQDQFKKSSNEKNIPQKLYNTFYDSDGKRPIYVENNLKHNFIRVQFSVPKLLYGNSLQTVKQEDTGKLEDILHRRLQDIYRDDFIEMQVSRLDVTQNLSVTNEIPLYIHALMSAYEKQSRYRLEKFSDQTLSIYNKSRKFLMYDKIAEAIDKKDITRSEAKAYPNLLRFEIQHSRAQSIKTSFNKKYTLSDILTAGFFEQAQLFQLNSFDKLFCNGGAYELFMQEISIMEMVAKYSKRNALKNFIIRNLAQDESFHFDFDKYEDLLMKTGKSIQGTRKSLKELRTLLSLSRLKTSDIIEELRLKLVA